MGKGFGGLSPGGTGYPCRCSARGGLAFFGCLSPLPLALFLPPIPQPPSRREGGDQSCFLQGASPLASPALDRLRQRLFHARGFAPCIPGLEPGRHLQNQPSGCPAGCCILPRLLCLPYQCFPAPYPPDPLPRRGRGRPKLFFARGSAPCIPATEPGRHWKQGGRSPPRRVLQRQVL